MMESPLRGRLGRPLVALACLALVTACFRADAIGPLFGDDDDSDGSGSSQQGYDPGVGGGVVLKDLFQGAVIEQANPSISRTWPANGDNTVNVKALLAVEFSESVDRASALSGILLFPAGSTTVVPASVQLFQGNRLAVIQPATDLVPTTSYELSIAGNITDLQGRQLSLSGGGSDQRVRFTTDALSADPPLSVVYSDPRQQEGSVTRSSEVVILFSEPVSSSTSGPGLLAPGNLVVTVNGRTLSQGGTSGEVTVLTLGGARLMGVRLTFRDLLGAKDSVRVKIDDDVESADGQHTLAGGKGFTLDYTLQDIAVPEGLSFPNSGPAPGADGFLSFLNLFDLQTDVDLTNDGQAPAKTTLLFFDAAQLNGLVFEKSAADPTRFQTDLEPDPNTPALSDGPILVGAFVQRKQFRSEVSVVKILAKDTVPPGLVAMGPPEVSLGFGPFNLGSLFYTYVRDPILYGRMDEPCLGIQVEFQPADHPDPTDPEIADFSSIQWQAGLSTVEQDFFLTGPSDDQTMGPQLEPYQSLAVIAADQYSNGAVGFDTVTMSTVGVVGAAVTVPDGTSALTVQAFDGETFATIGDGVSGTYGVVVVEPFPADPAGTGQVLRGFAQSGGLVQFTDGDLPGTAQITVTVIANGFQPVTFAGLTAPSAANPRALLPILQRINAQADPSVTVDTSQKDANSIVAVGGSDGDLDDLTAVGERFVVLPASGQAVELAANRPQVVTGVELPFTGGQVAASVGPMAYPEGAGPVTVQPPPLDFAVQPTDNSATPNVPRQVSFDNDQVLAGGAVGLQGAENNQYRRCRLLAHLPGFVEPVPLSSQDRVQFQGFGDAVDPTRVAEVLKPSQFLTNDTPDPTGTSVEDTVVELILQPDLIDPTVAVDTARQDQLLRVELHIEDRVDGAAQASGGLTRQRFFSDQTLQAASLQAVPALTPVDLNHPPLLDWSEETGPNGVHRLTLQETGGRRWQIYTPVVGGGGPVSLQVPLIASGFMDADPFSGNSQAIVFEFDLPDTYQAWVDSWDFDPSSGSAVYAFDFDRFYLTDLEREHFAWSRSDPFDTVTTN